MSAVPAFKPSTDTRAKVIDLSSVIRTTNRQKELKEDVKVVKKGNGKCQYNKTAGVSSRVYPFVSEEEIKAMIDEFNRRINEASDEDKKRVAARNKMLFVIGINLSLRASDLCGLTYKFFLKEDRTFKDSYSLQPKKTKKFGKFVTLYFNESVKKAITDYLNLYPVEDLNEYLFKSREGGHITSIYLGRIIKETAKAIGIERNICSHSLRQTFGYHVWHNAEDKEKALIMLMTIFNHSSVAITKRYIGIMDEEIGDVFNSLNLGLDFLTED